MKWDREELARTGATFGVALLVASYVYYVRQGGLVVYGKVLLIAGGLLLLASVVLGFKGIVRHFSQRSSQLGTNTLVLSLAVLAILGLLNFAGARHHKRFDLTTEKLFTLSDQTKRVVGGLQNDVNIARFDKTSDPALDDLMAEYKNLSPHLKFQNVDADKKPEVAKEFGATHQKEVIIAYGNRKEPLEPGARGDFTEEDITSAILKVTRVTQKMVCFVSGHGEKSLSDSEARGYVLVDTGLKKEAYLTKTINLVSENGVPADCSALVIAGPTQAYFPQEAEMVAKYLAGDGKALIEVDPDTDPKLDAVFQAWNVKVGKDLVIDASGVGRLFGTGPVVPLVVDYGASPITKNLQGGMTFFPLARSVTIADRSKSDPQNVELLKTSARSFTTPGLKQGQKEISFDPKTGVAGPLSLGVAGSSKRGDKVARLVVIGDSDFAANQWVSLQHNGDLFFNIVNWLAEDENLISIRPKTMTNRRVTLTEAQSAALHWLDLFILPGLFILSGVYIWWKRR
ncbi:MAG: GldG family protein [Candidatus Acidiferrales bacterium]